MADRDGRTALGFHPLVQAPLLAGVREREREKLIVSVGNVTMFWIENGVIL